MAILGPFLTVAIGSLLLSLMVLLLDGGVLGLPICLDAGLSDALRRFEFSIAGFGADAPDAFVVELVPPLGGELAVDPTNANDAVSLAEVDASSSLKFLMMFSDFLFIGTMGNWLNPDLCRMSFPDTTSLTNGFLTAGVPDALACGGSDLARSDRTL